MHLGMAIQAGAAEQKAVAEVVANVVNTIGHVRVPRGGMALLAEQGRKLGQQFLVVAAVWPMAQGAIFAGWRMFPKEGAAFFGVAGVAGFVDAGFLQQEIVRAVVRVVATAATHFAKPQGVAAGFEGVGTALFMAGKTGFLLSEGVKHPVPWPMHLVAGCAADPGGLVPAAKPAKPPVVLMAANTDFVLLPRGVG